MNFDPVIPHDPNKNDTGLANVSKNAPKNPAMQLGNKSSAMIASSIDQNTETKNPSKPSGMLKSSMNVKGVYNPKSSYKTPVSRSSISSESSGGIKEEPIISPFVQAETKIAPEQISSHNIINIPRTGQSLATQAENIPKPILNPQKPIPKQMMSFQPKINEQEEEKKKVFFSDPQLSSKAEEVKKPVEKIPSVPKNLEKEPSPLQIPSMEPIKNAASRPQGNPIQKSEPMPNIKIPDSKPENTPQRILDMSAGVKVQTSNKIPKEPEPIPRVKTEARPKVPAPELIPRKNLQSQEVPQIDKNESAEKEILDKPKLAEPSKDPKGAEPSKKPFDIPKKDPSAPLKKEEEEKKPIENQLKPSSLSGKGFAIPVKKKTQAVQPENSEVAISVKLKMVPFSEYKPKCQLVQNLNPMINLVPIIDNTEKCSIEPAEITNSDISDLIDLFLLQISRANQNTLNLEPKVLEIISKYSEDNPKISEFFSNNEFCEDCKHLKEKIFLDCGVEVCRKCTNKELASKTNSLMLLTSYDNITPLCGYCNFPYTEQEHEIIIGKNYNIYNEVKKDRFLYQSRKDKIWQGRKNAFKSARTSLNNLFANKCKSCKKVKRLSDFYEDCCSCLCKDCYTILKFKKETVCPHCKVDLKVKDFEMKCQGCTMSVNKIESCMKELCSGHFLCRNCLIASKNNKACARPDCHSALTEVQMLELKRFLKKTKGKD
ncbi:unnamed protein product [Blepharisma stoltei]|uniref:RING-type domain-containing protein n=1 Tax=Blepharisma stoltei TaxID=1481888 RepID=A0AAU9JQQ3_9CILI|nr:unnamed protein product [Blepharisma stoltei]